MEIPVNTDDLLALIGKLYVEAEFLRRELVALQAQLAESANATCGSGCLKNPRPVRPESPAPPDGA